MNLHFVVDLYNYVYYKEFWIDQRDKKIHDVYVNVIQSKYIFSFRITDFTEYYIETGLI